MILKYSVFGERCSGTSYLEELMVANFRLAFTDEYGLKHWWLGKDLTNSDDTLFIGIVRSPVSWLCSFYNNPLHIPEENKELSRLLFAPFVGNRKYNEENYKNIFEMRNVKIKSLLKDMPKKVKNYIFTTYESIRDDPKSFIEKVALQFNLSFNEFVPIHHYKKETNKIYAVKQICFEYPTIQQISEHLDWDLEMEVFTYPSHHHHRGCLK